MKGEQENVDLQGNSPGYLSYEFQIQYVTLNNNGSSGVYNYNKGSDNIITNHMIKKVEMIRYCK